MKIRRTIKSVIRQLKFGGSARHCPVCEHNSRLFLPTGVAPRDDALCPWCGSNERDRLVWCFFKQNTNLFDGKSKHFLHIAPEPCFQPIFQELPGLTYRTADLMRRNVMEQMDITDIQHPDDTFDAIHCSHVLEHVSDDIAAIREVHRVLKAGGWAVLNVPITADKTFEDPSITDPDERTHLFGQSDHVRRYGPDYIDRLRAGGFRVTCLTAPELAGEENLKRIGMSNGAAGEVYFCEKLAETVSRQSAGSQSLRRRQGPQESPSRPIAATSGTESPPAGKAGRT